jgi:hypothetical protein
MLSNSGLDYRSARILDNEILPWLLPHLNLRQLTSEVAMLASRHCPYRMTITVQKGRSLYQSVVQ